MNRVLVVDDESLICSTLRDHLSDEGYSVAIASNAEEALDAISDQQPDVILLDVRMPGMDGLSLLERLRHREQNIPVIIMTAFGTLETAIRSIQGGAVEYLTKPFDLDVATQLVERVVSPPQKTPRREASSEWSTTTLVGQSPAMQLVFKKIALVAETNTAVLVMGESGTGKELVAEAIHRNSPRRNGPFVPIHLAALNEQVIESELFGHVQGSFTGADRDRSGLFEQAQGGTLFLDEIGDVPLGVQVKILRAIERKEFTPVGDPRPRSCDFRLVAATHRPLSQMVAQGKFRADLFFRLTAFQIEMPPLRDRLDDLPALTSHLLARIRGKESSGILSTEFLDELRHRPWIGNVRELLQALESAAIMARDGELQPEHLPTPLISVASYSETPEERATLEQNLERWVQSQLNQEGGMELRSLHSDLLEKIEPILFREVLAACHGHRGKAADLLGIHRGTLRDKLRQYQIAGED